jgi:stearoyl-CoA desaturase (delta-9 desaturase)
VTVDNLAAAPEMTRGKPMLGEPMPWSAMVGLILFVTIPFVALAAAVPVAWGWGLSWRDVGIALVAYLVSGFGATVGFHRYFTHGSFKVRRWLRVTLAAVGSLSLEGEVIQWVADHRRHHAYTDREGDPHSPWRYGTSAFGLLRGLYHAHCGWLFQRQWSNRERFAPDLMADRDIVRVDRLFPALAVVSLLTPPLVGGLVSWSWQGAVSGMFWGSLVRVALLHHVTWSINSICHVYGERPFKTRAGDRAANFWPLAVLSFGESWHNSHHADPTCARHGVLRGQLDPTARIIRWLEQAGWAYDVRWPRPRPRADAREAIL